MLYRYPHGNLIYRNLQRDFPVISHGEGLYLYDTNGKRYIDAAGGALVMSVGHGNREVADSIAQELHRVAYVNGTQFTSECAERLASRLCERAKNLGLTRATFLGSGSEAVEAAIKFCRQVWVERGEEKRCKIISRMPSYHGNTLFALSVSGRPHYRKFFSPFLQEPIFISAPYRYRSETDDYGEKAARHYAGLLEKAIVSAGPETVAAFILEPIIGSSAAGAVPPLGYLAQVQEICRKYGVFIIADEILCGSGRTGKFFASEHDDFKPDLLCLGKGINGGYASLSVVMTQEKYVDEIQKGSGYFSHAQTYMHAPCMVAAGNAVLDFMDRRNLVENSQKVGSYLHERLRETLFEHPHVGHIDGMGLLAGIEFVKDKRSKQPFSRNEKITERITSAAFEEGLILWPNVGHVDGVNGDLVMLGPPLTLTKQEADEIVASLQKCLVQFFD